MRHLHHFQPAVAVDLERRNFLPDAIDQNLAAAARNRTEASFLEFRNHLAQRHAEGLGKMLKLGRTESVNVDVRIFFADVMEKIDIPIEAQFRMMPPLHQDLNTACG